MINLSTIFLKSLRLRKPKLIGLLGFLTFGYEREDASTQASNTINSVLFLDFCISCI